MATARNAFLICEARPDLAPSNIFVVSEGAVRITANGLIGGDYVVVQKQTSPASGSFAATWAPVVRQGQAVRLSQNNIEHIELISGIYRVVRVGAESDNIIVHMMEDQQMLDAKLQYTLPAYNPNFNGAVTGTGLSPALVNSRNRLGHWCYDTTLRIYVWVEANTDTSTGAVTYSFFDAPGGNTVVPEKLIQQPLDYPSCEQLLFYTISGAGSTFNLSDVPATLLPKKITIVVDTGSYTMIGALTTSMVIVPADGKYTFEVTSPMGQLEHQGNYLVITPVTGVGDKARIIVQACHVSPACAVVVPPQ